MYYHEIDGVRIVKFSEIFQLLREACLVVLDDGGDDDHDEDGAEDFPGTVGHFGIWTAILK